MLATEVIYPLVLRLDTEDLLKLKRLHARTAAFNYNEVMRDALYEYGLYYRICSPLLPRGNGQFQGLQRERQDGMGGPTITFEFPANEAQMFFVDMQQELEVGSDHEVAFMALNWYYEQYFGEIDA